MHRIVLKPESCVAIEITARFARQIILVAIFDNNHFGYNGPLASDSFFQRLAQFCRVIAFLAQHAHDRGEETDSLLRVVHDCCVPNRILSVLAAGDECPKEHPAHGKRNIGDGATAYVCVGDTCLLPFTDPEDLRNVLAGSRPAAIR
jgi:hypothetical protein